MDQGAKKRLLDLTPLEISDLVLDMGEKPYRAEQLLAGLFRRGARTFADFTDLAKNYRERLSQIAEIGPRLTLIESAQSQDGAQKLLWRAPDGLAFESVLIPEKGHYTLCLSTQVGCALGCRFCRTGDLGLSRDLSQGEILAQVLEAKKFVPQDQKLTNIVFMGMGEPLLNLKALLNALFILNSPKYLAFAGSKISLSTVGIPKGLTALAESGHKIGLTVSLGAAQDALRDELMPINRRFPLSELKKALLAYPLKSGQRFTIAYVLLKGVNDSPTDALALSRFLADLKTKINLIPFNPWPNAPFERPDEATIQKFWRVLYDKNHTVMVRWSKGGAVAGACGQLAGGNLGLAKNRPKELDLA
ncbi:MAG: 23S rRNA (adenine(2503)-C(2))-methyltransferase RlmN [Deltaproteobacteria bacterium]|jgi:23S rRNA (adenine2503-C2)-methyltransferase|nr:23S rRNA (adenine(2503)-C(2))-methyltransferase RlmN [Deltaproteobacteria bacterium]